MSSHGTLVNAVISYINARGGFAWKNQSGTLPVGNRFVHVGTRGLPDVVGVWPTVNVEADIVGQLIAVEVKTGTGRLTRQQIVMHEELRKRGALVIVARSIVDVENALK